LENTEYVALAESVSSFRPRSGQYEFPYEIKATEKLTHNF